MLLPAPCSLPTAHLVAVRDEEHAVVCGGDLKGMRLVDDVLRALDRQALLDLEGSGVGLSASGVGVGARGEEVGRCDCR